jgi:hypothetical protein
MNNKNSEFLWLVQMIMTKHIEAIDGWSGIAGDAVAASHRIPKEMTVREAALVFCSVFIKGFAGPEFAPVPSWMLELNDPAGTAYPAEN